MAEKKYWAGGFGEPEVLNDFILNNYWAALKYDSPDQSSTAKSAFENFDKIKKGDWFAIKGFSPQKIKIHYIGEVISKDDYKKSISFKSWGIEKFELSGRPRTGRWPDTLIEVTDGEAIQEIFFKRWPMNAYTKLLEHKHQIILQGPPGTGKTRVAKEIAYKLIKDDILPENEGERKKKIKELEDSGNFKLIQFHPAYSYEDFVRGITAKSNGNNIEYKTENKVLGEFAEKAYKNLEDSKKDVTKLSEEKQLEKYLEELVDEIQETLDEKGKFPISKSAYIFEIDEDAFRYKGDNWATVFRMPFSEIIKLYNFGIAERKEIKKQSNLSGRTKQHATYFFNFLLKFKDHVNKNKNQDPKMDSFGKIDKQNFVLIIDEINRANLPAVLGELIYALEYRGESVESMYEIDEDRKITLPENLYIIGTMNTADRSVGHIDYAIRRRFAFMDVIPSGDIIKQVISDPNLLSKAITLYENVEKLFIESTSDSNSEKKYLASDFSEKDVQLGHSYFLAKTEDELKLKLDYEIKPILREYVKDGILKEEAKKVIEGLNV